MMLEEHQLERVERSGWSLAMHVLRVDDELLVHSPTATSDDVFERLDALGRVRVIVAPNHFHHLGLAAFRARYPDANVVAAERAIPRLRAQGHGGVAPIEGASLPAGIAFHVASGVRTGETFLSYDVAGQRTLLVCDAFFHVTRELRGPMGVVLRATKTAPGLQTGRTFKYLAIDDREAYLAWIEQTLDAVRPARVCFSHGAPIEGPALVDTLLASVRERLG
jgi:hypothetical protein